MKIAIVEDEIIIADEIEATLEGFGYETIEPCINYTQALSMLKDNKPDLIIIDIQLAGKKDGIDLAHYILENYRIPFIFLTSNSDSLTIERAKAVNPPAYLIKPFMDKELCIAIEMALSNHSKTNELAAPPIQDGIILKDAIFIKKKQYYIRIDFEDILYIVSDRVYLEIILTSSKKHVVRGGINQILENLPQSFARIHRSYIINLSHLQSINTITVTMGESVKIPLSKSHRTNLIKSLNRYPPNS